MLCRETQDLLAGYAVGALEQDEHRLVDEHLDAGCEACRLELADLMVAASSLALADEQQPPPPSVKSRLMDRIAAEATPATAAEPPMAARSGGRARSWRLPLAVAIAAGLAGVLAAVVPQANNGPGLARSGGPSDPALRADLDAYRQRIAKTNRLLGLSRVRLVTVDAEPLDAGLRPRLIYDDVSHQLHVLVPEASLPESAANAWAWVTGDKGGVVSRGRFTRVGGAYAGAVIDLSRRPAKGAQLILTIESADDPLTPSGAVFGKTAVLFADPG